MRDRHGPGRHTAGAGPRTLAALATLALVAVLAGCSPWSRFEAVPAGAPGADGPCASGRRVLANPSAPGREVVLVEPTGVGGPWTGGSCNDGGRPLAVLLHGWGGSNDAIYGGLIAHLVSNGFVVVFPTYGNDLDLAVHEATVDAGTVAAVAASGRVDTSRVGVLGHSMGGGMSPWLLQRAVDRGWGTAATWLTLYAPWYAFGLPDGPIDVPAGTSAAVVAYDADDVVDARIGIELLRSLTVDDGHRTHVLLRSDITAAPVLVADHLGPVSFRQHDLGGLSADHYDRWSTYRTADAMAGCALDGRWCDTDLSRTGSRPDGRPLAAAVVSDDPVDAGPVASWECSSWVNPRGCP